MLRSHPNLRRRFCCVIAASGWLCAEASLSAATIGPATLVGTMSSTTLREVSGLIDSRANSKVFWVHNDSGDSARFFATNHQGVLLGTFTLTGASATDWEDAAIGEKPGGGNYLYFADIGDNAAARSSIDVYRVTEPTSTGAAMIPASAYSRTRLQYPGGARNAEALIVDPLTSDLFILSKAATTQLYRAPASAFGSVDTVMLTSLGNVVGAINTVTAADISPDGRYILVRSKSAARLYERGIGQSIAQALQGTGMAFALGAETQGEAIAWSAGGGGFYTTSEFNGNSSAPVYGYWFAARGLGDFDDDGDMDGHDLAVWSASFGDDLGGDADGDGHSDGADFMSWQRHFTGPRAKSPSSVAEPQCGWLVPAGSALLFALMRRALGR